MLKANVIAMRNKFKSINKDYLKVAIDENYSFTSKDSFFIWDDNGEILTVIAPNKNTQMVPTKAHRVEVLGFEYDRILFLSTVPESVDSSWVDSVVTDAEMKKTVKNSIKIVTEDKYFIE